MLAVAGLLLIGCSSVSEPGSTAVLLWRGADVSALERIEQAGGTFRSGGQPGDAIAILRAKGVNLFRLRLFVRPNYQDVQVNDLAYTIRLAQRIRAAGGALLLDLHYSDTWADPGHQTTPAAWQGIGIDSLVTVVETYTAAAVDSLRESAMLPRMVQIGNEVDHGMLWPIGQVTGTGGDTLAQWDRFTRLLKAAAEGVRDALRPGDSVAIVIHYSRGADAGATRWFFDHIEAAGVPYDVIGLSYYPWWHGTYGALSSNLNAAAARYHRPVMVVETSYPWRAGGWEGMVVDTSAMQWPATPLGQDRFLCTLIGAVASVPGNAGAGVVWWYPEAIAVPGLSVWGGGSLALFDSTTDILPAAGQFAGP